jgi:purine-binding chemotaxis protein CheW
MATNLADRQTVVVFSVAGARYAVPLEASERVVRMPALAPLPGVGEPFVGALNLHGSTVPVVDLRAPADRGGPSLLDSHLLIVRTPRRRLALAADEVQGVRDLPLSSVAPAAGLVDGLHAVRGIAAFPDGLLFIYDVEALLSAEQERRLAAVLAAS